MPQGSVQGVDVCTWTFPNENPLACHPDTLDELKAPRKRLEFDLACGDCKKTQEKMTRNGEHILFGIECALEDESRCCSHDFRTIFTNEGLGEDLSWPSDNVGRSVHSFLFSVRILKYEFFGSY